MVGFKSGLVIEVEKNIGDAHILYGSAMDCKVLCSSTKYGVAILQY